MINLNALADEWTTELEAAKDEEREPEVAAYEALADELGIDQTPDALDSYAYDVDGDLILEREFVDYARDLAYELTDAPLDQWPLTCIDWDSAADELAHDYTSVSYDGDNYYIRA